MVNINKYKNKKVIINGEVFDSKHEYSRFLELKLLEKSGAIYDLRRQVPYELIPVQREPSTRFYKKGRKRGEPVPGKVIEQNVEYKADFVYIDDHGKTVVEDAKGKRTADYVIKRKLMLHVHGIKVQEV